MVLSLFRQLGAFHHLMPNYSNKYKLPTKTPTNLVYVQRKPGYTFCTFSYPILYYKTRVSVSAHDLFGLPKVVTCQTQLQLLAEGFPETFDGWSLARSEHRGSHFHSSLRVNLWYPKGLLSSYVLRRTFPITLGKKSRHGRRDLLLTRKFPLRTKV